MAAIPGMQERTITVNSMSKTYAMCGWRLGWAHGPRELIAQMVKFQEHIVACAPSVAQAAAIAALEGPQDDLADMVARYGQRRHLLVEPSQELALNLLKSAGVVTVPGVGFGPEVLARKARCATCVPGPSCMPVGREPAQGVP
jgi:aspartate/methionine/tyrosine aminotransferase